MILILFFLIEKKKKKKIHVRLLAWHTKFEKCKALKKELNKELMPAAWHPNRLRDWCMLEDKKKEIDPIFIEEL